MAVTRGGILVYISAVIFLWCAVMFDATHAQDPCDNCMVIGGMGVAEHPTNCGMYIQCVPEGGGWIPFDRICIPGLFWNPAGFACQRPPTVLCPNDPCLSSNNIGVPHPDYCGAYWECIANRAVSLQCCPPGMSYNTGQQRCTNDGTCVDGCHYSNDGTTFLCLFSQMPGVPNQFRSFDGAGGVRNIFTCGLGTIWSDDRCTCDHDPLYVPPVFVQPVGQDCLDLRLQFDTSFSDTSGNGPLGVGWYVSGGGSEIRALASANGGGAMYCGGGDVEYPSIPRYANVDFGYLSISFRYLLDDGIALSGDSRDLALFSNSVCDGVSTISIGVNRNNNALQARVSVLGVGPDYVLTVNPRQGRPGGLSNVWVGVSFVFTGATMRLTVNEGAANSNTDSVAVGGNILTAPTGIRLCDGSGYRSLRGYIDDFTVYMCDPN